MGRTTEYQRLVDCCRELPPAKGVYLIDDYVRNMILTVIDYCMRTKAVERAHDYFVATHGESIRTHHQLKDALLRFPETKEGNIDAARFLWNYRLWTRVQQLRGLLNYFESRGVMTQEELRRWAGPPRHFFLSFLRL